MDTRSLVSGASQFTAVQRAAPAPGKKFSAKCNLCSGKLDARSVLTSCRHFVCRECIKGGTCPVCNQACRTVQLNSTAFPTEIKERCSLVIDDVGAKAVAACRMQNGHLAQISDRQALLLQRAQSAVSTQKQHYRSLEAKYAKLKQENASLRFRTRRTTAREDDTPPPLWTGGGGGGGGGGYPCSRSNSVASSILGKTLMQE